MIETEMKTILRRQANRWAHYVNFLGEGVVGPLSASHEQALEVIGSFYDPGKHTLNHDVMDYAPGTTGTMLHTYVGQVGGYAIDPLRM
jgi:hypothetical protein